MGALDLSLQTSPPRRYAALAFVIERIARRGTSPAYIDIARHLDVSETRAKQLVAQLVREGLIEVTPGAQRSLRVLEMSRSRSILQEVLSNLGWSTAEPMGALQPPPFPKGQLPMLPAIEHLPDVD